MTLFPLADGELWAWWAWSVSATVGFSSFLAYLADGFTYEHVGSTLDGAVTPAAPLARKNDGTPALATMDSRPPK